MYFNGIMPDRIYYAVNSENNNFQSCVVPMPILKVMLYTKE